MAIRCFGSRHSGSVGQCLGRRATIGDVNGDGWPDIIAGEGPAPNAFNGSRLSVWDGKTGVFIGGGFSLSTTHKGGLRVGAGDIDNDGRDEIFTCFGPSNDATRMDVLRYNPNVPNIGYVRTARRSVRSQARTPRRLPRGGR